MPLRTITDKMRFTFLGTGTSQGIPVIACSCRVCQSLDPRDNRLRSSLMVEGFGKRIVVDTGPDFRQQMLRLKIDHLDAVLFTHEHKDHIAGLDDVRAFNFHQGTDMNVYGTKAVHQALKREFHYAFAEVKYPGVPEINLIEIDHHAFSVEGIPVIPVEVMHYKMPVKGFRFGDFTYITDAKTISDEELEKVKGTKILVLNALRKKEHISHFTLDEAIAVMEKIRPEKGYLTHISHLMGTHREIAGELPEYIELAYDGLSVEI